MFANVLLITFCVVLNCRATHETTEKYNLPIPSPPLDLPAYPYQEDLISSIRYLKDEPKIKDEKVRGLINILKMILEKQLEDSIEVYNEGEAPNTEIIGDGSRQKKETVKHPSTKVNPIHPINQEMINKLETPLNNDANVPLFRIQVGSSTPGPNLDASVFQLNAEDRFPEIDRRNVNSFRPRPVSNYVENESRYPKNPLKFHKQNMFNIPCHKASDVLEDMPRFAMPREVYYGHSNARPNMNFVPEGLRPISGCQEPAVTNSITCTESEETVAMLFKPKTISLKQVYGNLLKKITVNVLVPYHVSKIAI